MMKHANIIFAPYNYIIDPRIRNAMGINLAHTGILFDEAHNILDKARESASMSCNLFDITIQHNAFSRFVQTVMDERTQKKFQYRKSEQSHTVCIF
jgi:Rad3-related DNA helicase